MPYASAESPRQDFALPRDDKVKSCGMLERCDAGTPTASAGLPRRFAPRNDRERSDETELSLDFPEQAKRHLPRKNHLSQRID